MLSSISWQTYWTVTGIMIAAYYLFVLAVFYQKEILAFLTHKPSDNDTDLPPLPATSVMGKIQEQEEEGETVAESPETMSTENLEYDDDVYPGDFYEEEASDKEAFDALEQFSKELQSLMDGYGKKGNRTELVMLIQNELMIFSAANDTQLFKETLNDFITEQCRTRCNIRLEPADIKTLWLKDPD